jgi:probable F420-dependent oxidoreductase
VIDDLRGTVGVWTNLVDRLTASELRSLAREIEQMGYDSLWFPEARGREAFTQAAVMLAAAERIVVGTAIANVWARDPMAMAGAAKTLGEAFSGRFVLGLGVSHRETVTTLRGHDYAKPVRFVREYLHLMDGATYLAPEPVRAVPRLLAALGPKMLETAGALCDGAIPYFSPLEHTVSSREILHHDKLLLVVQMAVMEDDLDRATDLAREGAARYLTLRNYTNNLRRFGFTDDDFADGGSDRLLDAVVARRGLDSVVARVEAQRAAGADMICLQLLATDTATLLARLGSLAPRLL